MSPEEALLELKRGTDEILSEIDLLEKLRHTAKTKKPLIVKAGFDPTAPDIHLGHTVLMQKMAQFQKLGHTAVFLIGDFTALVGDPSGKTKTRPQLSREEVLKNTETYKKQVFKILDDRKTQIRFNSEWLETLSPYDFVKLASHANVARMLEREDFNKRYTEGQSISLHEFIYPLLQAYDSVMLKADVELGGRDQKFNLLLGRELMRDYGLEPQVCLTVPLLEGLGGIQKMSKTLNNSVGIEESAQEMYGKLMSLPDRMLRRYYDLLSARLVSETEELFKKMELGEINPKEVKSRLACEIIERYHSKVAAEEAKGQFEKVFSKKELPDDISERTHAWDGKPIWLPKLLKDVGWVPSTSYGKRMIDQGAVKINERVISDENWEPKDRKNFILQCGKRKFMRVLLQK